MFSSATLYRLSRSARTIFSPPLRRTPSGDTRATSACSEQRGNCAFDYNREKSGYLTVLFFLGSPRIFNPWGEEEVRLLSAKRVLRVVTSHFRRGHCVVIINVTRTHAHTNNADSFGCPLCFCLYLPCSSFMHDWSARFFWESGACPCTFSQTVFELVYGGQCPRKRGAFISFSLITIGRTSLCLLPAVFCARNLR